MKVKSIKLLNFLSYESLELKDLDAYNFIVLSGENGSGKSAIIESIIFNLYGKSFRGNIGDLVFKGKEKLSTEIEYTIKKNHIKIIREFQASKKDEDGFFIPFGSNSILKVIVNGKDLTHKKIKTTQEKIIGQFFPYSFDFFCKSHYFRKGILKDDGESLPISDLIEELFEVKKIDLINDKCIKDKRNMAKAFVEEAKNINMKHSRLLQLKNLKNKEDLIIKGNISSRKDLILERVNEGKSLQEINKNIEKDILTNNTKKEELRKERDLKRETKKAIENQLYFEKETLSKKEALFKKQLCSMCERPFSQEDTKKIDTDINNLKESISAKKNKLMIVQKELENAERKLVGVEQTENLFKEKFNKNTIEIKFIKEAVRKIQEEILQYEKEDNGSIINPEEVKKLEKEILKAFNVLTQTSYVYSLYDKITEEMKEGSPFRYYFIRLPELNDLISFYCEYFNLNYSIKLEFNKKGKIDIRIYSKTKDEVFKFANLSQGQSRRTILVILFSVISYLTNNSRHLGVLFFDEILENLDSKGAETVLEYMGHLKQQGLQIFFISHSYVSHIYNSEISDKTFWAEIDELSGASKIKEEKI